MEMDLSIWLQLAVVLVCVAVGGRLGGVGLGAAGGLGVCILVLGMGIQPGVSSDQRPAHYYGSDCLHICSAGFGRSGSAGAMG